MIPSSSSDEDEFDAKVRLLNRAPAVDATHVDDNMAKRKEGRRGGSGR